MAGYSSTPLKQKLGLKDDYVVKFINVPNDYFTLIDTPKEKFKTSDSKEDVIDFIHSFVYCAGELRISFPLLKSAIKKDGTVWISWPKNSSKLKSDINENVIREIGLENGLVDVKVCAVDENWSGLKFVYRVNDR